MFKLRLKIFLCLVGLIFLIIFVRLADLQLIKGNEYRRQYEQMLRHVSSLPAVRGRILDRNGYILAMDEPCFDICLEYKFISEDDVWRQKHIEKLAEDKKVTLENAGEIYQRQFRDTWTLIYRIACDVRALELGVEKLPTSEQQEIKEELQYQISSLVKRIKRIREKVGGPIRMETESYPMVYTVNEITALKYRDKVEEALGASVRPGSARRYPYNEAAAHIIGFTSPVDTDDLRINNLQGDGYSWFDRNEKDYHFDDWVGKAGVERMCEPLLRGIRGYKLRVKPGQVENQQSQNGQDVHLTIDINLQRKVSELFGSRHGCAIIMTVPDRQILAMVSLPTYNLNAYRRDYSKLVSDGLYLPLLHRAVRRLYPPGSIAKPLAALAGLHYGVISPETTIDCRGRLFPGRPGFGCWNRSGHGPLNLYEAIQKSCNIYFYKTGQNLGLDRLSGWYENFEFGKVPASGLPEETAGVLPKSDGREDVGESRLIAIGQGPIAVTPLHVAGALAGIATGEYRSPMLVLEASALPEGPEFKEKKLPLTRAQLQAVHEGMYRAVNRSGGTLNRIFHENMPKSEACGKSGTADTTDHTYDLNKNGRIDAGERLDGNMAWAAAFAPRHNPQIAVIAVVEYTSEHGGEAAGPIVRDCLNLCESPEFGYLKP